MAIATWYTESKLSTEYENLASSNKIINYSDKLNNSLINSQWYFSNYIKLQDENTLKKYAAEIDTINFLMDSLRLVSQKNKILEKTLKEKNKTKATITVLKFSIDSIINKQLSEFQKEGAKPFQLKKIQTKDILQDIKTNSYVKVDKANHKGLISRLADAFAGRVTIQKEYLKTVVKMKYKDKLTTGEVEEQIANIISFANKYYEDEFILLKNSFLNLKNSDLKLMKLNNELLQLTQSMKSDYSNSTQKFKTNNLENIAKLYEVNKTIRSYSIVVILFLMFVISVILFNFTRLAFEYEKRLIQAQHQIKQSLNFKNRITGMISHEIRSPLSIIAMYSKKAISSVKDVEMKETFKSIEFTTNSLLLLSNQILEYSKDENQKLSLKCNKVNLKTEIDQIISSMNSLVEIKGNSLVINSNLILDYEVDTDIAKIHQLFYNIIGNATKYTENGIIKIGIDAKPISDYETNLKVEIEDNGIGIAEDELKSVFDSYYQGTVSEKMTDLGVGLGLNICKEIIELFEGEINIQSKLGKGTKVIFNLVLTQV